MPTPAAAGAALQQAERISICSIEKANGAVNKMIQEQRLHELVSVTIDEAHMLADTNRCALPYVVVCLCETYKLAGTKRHSTCTICCYIAAGAFSLIKASALKAGAGCHHACLLTHLAAGSVQVHASCHVGQ